MSLEHPAAIKRPTEKAEFMFQSAANLADGGMAKGGLDPFNTASLLRSIAMGLRELAVGVRATYLVMDEVRAALRSVAMADVRGTASAPATAGRMPLPRSDRMLELSKR